MFQNQMTFGHALQKCFLLVDLLCDRWIKFLVAVGSIELSVLDEFRQQFGPKV